MVHHFTRDLVVENTITQHPVDVLGIMMGAVDTAGNNVGYTNFNIISSERMARSVLDRVGCGYDMVTGDWHHCITAEMLKWLPRSMAQKMLNDATFELAELEKAKMEKTK